METQTLMPLEEEYTTSPAVGELMDALARAQATMTNPDEDKNNPAFNSRYPSIASVRNASIPALAAVGIAVTQFGFPLLARRAVRCVTTFWLKEQYLKGMMVLPVTKSPRRGEAMPDPAAELNKQDYAGTITYGRRIQLLCMSALAGELDDDGNDETREERERRERRDRQEREKRPEPGAMLGKSAAVVTKPAATDDPVEAQRLALVDAIAISLKGIVLPLNHAGLYKALLHHCFEAGHYTLKNQSLSVLQTGMPLFHHLCEELQAEHWNKTQHPEEWIAQEQRKLAALARGDAPRNVEAPTGEDAPGPQHHVYGSDSPDLMAEEEAEDRAHVLSGDPA